MREGRTYIWRVVKITISRAAFAAIAATLPGNVAIEPGRAADGSIGIWLDRSVVDELHALRQPHEGLSEVILRVAAETAER
jgi:hypothetical protein